MASPAKKGVDLAIVLGGPPKKGRGGPPMGDDDEMMPDDDEDDHGDSDAAFDVAFEEYEMAEGPEERKAAFKRAIEACLMGKY